MNFINEYKNIKHNIKKNCIIIILSLYYFFICLRNKMNIGNNISPKYIPDLSGKFLFMRHGQSLYNQVKEESRRYNPDLIDASLSEEGIKQAKSRQEDINQLDIEKVYVSPYKRALETMIYALQSHPNADKIIATVNPLISEIVCSGHDFMIDLKQTKKKFNMNSPIKIDWSYFDEFVKNSKYDENFFFFENMNLLEEKEKQKEYLKLKDLYDKGKTEKYKEELGKFLKENNEKYRKYESFKHSYERFEKLKKYLNEEFKETINDKNKKVLCVCHSAFINVATSPIKFSKDEIVESKDNLYQIQNGEIISLMI